MKSVCETIKAAIVLSLLVAGMVSSTACTADPAMVIKSGPTDAAALMIGNWADPTILKDRDTYYMTHTSFEYQPGLLIWRSKDLRTWTPVTRATVNQSGSIWAPDLVKHNGEYRIYYPADRKNWVVTARKIEGPWSKPVELGASGIDPGFVADEDGRQYVHLSAGLAAKLSDDGRKVAEKPKKVYKGWPIPQDWTIEGFYLESPKLMNRRGWYYLTSAQGGTAGPSTSHMVVSARSKTPLGPWTNSPYNPIIRTWDRDEPWWSKGHGTPVAGLSGKWFCVLHGYMNSQRTLGRSTLIEPIEWTSDGWFRRASAWPDGWKKAPMKIELNNSDEFDGDKLGIQWAFYKQYEAERVKFANGALGLQGRGETPGLSHPMAVMAMDRAYEIETQLTITGDGGAGLMLFGSPTVYIGLAITSDGKLKRIQEGYRHYGRLPEVKLNAAPVKLRITNNKQDVRISYKVGKEDWKTVQPGQDVAMTKPAWHSLRPALFAHGEAKATFEYFRYKPLGKPSQ